MGTRAPTGFRIGDLLHPEFLRHRLEDVLPLKNYEMAFYGLPPLKIGDLLAKRISGGKDFPSASLTQCPSCVKRFTLVNRFCWRGNLG